MTHPRRASRFRQLAVLWVFLCLPQIAAALDVVRVDVAGDDATLRKELKAASLVQATLTEGRTNPRNVYAAALADYGRMVETLYANAYYSGVVRILIDGREAASIPLLSAPRRIGTVTIRVDPGPRFRFGQAQVAPLAPGTDLPAGFRSGEPAQSSVVKDAVETAVLGWRDVGHAKAAPDGQSLVADHVANSLYVRVKVAPGPRVRFGDLDLTTPSAVRAARIIEIAGKPNGKVFSPETLDRMAQRLRRTGAFTSVTFSEADALGPGDTMDIGLAVVDEKPRRLGFGAEISSLEGIELSGYWLHRNLFGGAERLRLDARVSQIGGGAETGGIDYSFGARLERPATFSTETTVFALAGYEHLEEPDFTSDQISLGFGARQYFSDRRQIEAGVTYIYSETDDALGKRDFSLLTFPISGTWDRRDDLLDPTTGFYVNAQVTPFLGLDGSASGARTFFDARAYRGFGAEKGVVLAGRLQFGSVAGAELNEVPPGFLFYSGGGGTVRGQPYQSLDVDLGGGNRIGGRSFLGLSGEIRTSITDKLGAVAFVDAGYVGAESLYDGTGNWHSGGGLGVRYKTPVGPIRFDVAAPISGNTGAGVQFYIGIGQAF